MGPERPLPRRRNSRGTGACWHRAAGTDGLRAPPANGHICRGATWCEEQEYPFDDSTDRAQGKTAQCTVGGTTYKADTVDARRWQTPHPSTWSGAAGAGRG